MDAHYESEVLTPLACMNVNKKNKDVWTIIVFTAGRAKLKTRM